MQAVKSGKFQMGERGQKTVRSNEGREDGEENHEKAI